MRVVLTSVLLLLCARAVAWAQPGATGPVATLNAEAKDFSICPSCADDTLNRLDPADPLTPSRLQTTRPAGSS